MTPANLSDFVPAHMLHPAFWHLNLAHRSDYLRAFFMHHIGGAYCDIKPLKSSWENVFQKLEESNLIGAGYREIHRHAVANVHQSSVLVGNSRISRSLSYIRWRWLQLNHERIIGNCAFIFKPGTDFTLTWLTEVNRRLDDRSQLLQRFPAAHAKERMGELYDGSTSNYPVPWSFLLGDVMQPLALRYSKRLEKTLPPPGFSEYQ